MNLLKMINKENIYSTIIFLLGISLLSSCKDKETTLPPSENTAVAASVVQLTEAQLKNANLQVSVAEKMNIGHVVHLNGTMEVMPENTITVSSPMAGFVRQIKWMPGMNVLKGQVLVRLEEKEYIQLQQDYLSAKNALTFAKLDFDRQSALSQNKATSDKVFQLAEEKVKQNQILLQSLGEKLKLIHVNPSKLTADNMTSQIVVTAPVSGTITEVAVNTGKYVLAGDAMIKMIDSRGARLVLKAFEKDLLYIKPGQRILAFSNSKSDKKINGKVDYVVNNIGDQGFASVICSLENTSSDLLQGMYMNAEVEAQNMESWVVPDDAIVNYEGKEYVFVDKGSNSFEMVEVTTGLKENEKVQIINYQIFMNKKIVIDGAYTLLMKMKNVAE